MTAISTAWNSTAWNSTAWKRNPRAQHAPATAEHPWAEAWGAIRALVAADTLNRAAEAEGRRWPVAPDLVTALRAEADQAIATALRAIPAFSPTRHHRTV